MGRGRGTAPGPSTVREITRRAAADFQTQPCAWSAEYLLEPLEEAAMRTLRWLVIFACMASGGVAAAMQAAAWKGGPMPACPDGQAQVCEDVLVCVWRPPLKPGDCIYTVRTVCKCP